MDNPLGAANQHRPAVVLANPCTSEIEYGADISEFLKAIDTYRTSPAYRQAVLDRYATACGTDNYRPASRQEAELLASWTVNGLSAAEILAIMHSIGFKRTNDTHVMPVFKRVNGGIDERNALRNGSGLMPATAAGPASLDEAVRYVREIVAERLRQLSIATGNPATTRADRPAKRPGRPKGSRNKTKATTVRRGRRAGK